MPQIIDNSETREGSARLRSRRGIPIYEETYTYIVVADHKLQTRAEILSTTGLPIINVTGGPGGYSICRALDATRRTANPLYWDVRAEFSSEIEENSDPSSGNKIGDPETWIPIYETKFERYQEVVAKDFSGAPFVNSAKQSFSTGLTITRHIPIWEFFQFEPASVTDETVIERSETVNANEFRGRAEHTLLLIVMSSIIGFYYGIRRRLTHYQLKYNRKNWKTKMLDVGSRHLSLDGTKMVPYQMRINPSGTFTADNLIRISGPLVNGGPAGGYETGTDYAVIDDSEPDILEFAKYPTSDFLFLRIP